ncbi:MULTISPECIES: hypothetical protein [Trichocoleus]|uniref:Uncharacterized protein n=1 Tax=Trichocoleus desertorum GB2-A4 TaxID=2933944 RepID=A0ABV0JE15_9CYAN|nr:hypothetical protein [Trichocoleus sp. FACHB-46]MBD1865204.1 hypothetical protein [Trichocoleus sp. FACHB-46]
MQAIKELLTTLTKLGTTLARLLTRFIKHPWLIKLLLPRNFEAWKQNILNELRTELQFIKEIDRRRIEQIEASDLDEIEKSTLTKHWTLEIKQRLTQAEEVTDQLEKTDQKYQKILESIKKLQRSYRRQVRLPIWIANKLPEEWHRQLVENRRQWIAEKQPRLLFHLNTIKYLLQTLKAAVLIKWEDGTLFSIRKGIDKGSATHQVADD